MINDMNDILHDGNDRTEILDTLSDEVLINSLKEQIIDPSTTSERNLQNFDRRYTTLMYYYKDSNEELVADLKDARMAVYDMVADLLKEHYDLEVERDNIIETDYIMKVRHLYDFFVLGYKDNLITYLQEYIRVNRKDIIREYKNDVNRRDILVQMVRKQVDEFNDVVVIINIDKIIDLALEPDNTNGYNIIKLIVDADPMDAVNYNIKSYILSDDPSVALAPEFATKFLSKIDNDKFNLGVEVKLAYIKDHRSKTANTQDGD